ncbi:hypothetical protein ACFSKU_02420 [Pontibacter silvestris]|uniref:Uncharacterized protein n=1 Tax=Pontibacter silvestris TaxID=2305183 RepID=A0ABW4WST8_9BACT|nr:hypothetical protein [Pontibacter silvestris]MCC9137750.1 hypothetical protein [Pontibacter silvestris]
MLQKIRSTAIALIIITVAACNSNGSQQEGETAFQEYEAFVTQVERDTSADVTAIDSSAWNKSTQELQQEFDQHTENMEVYLESFKPERREEVRNLMQRYDQAFERRQQNYEEVSRRYKLRKEMLGVEVNSDDLNNIKAQDLPETYQQFVNALDDRKENLDSRDWEIVEGLWSALNNRKRSLENELDQSARNTIEQQQKKFLEISNNYKTTAQANATE